MPTWPLSLPQSLPLRSPETRLPNNIRTGMDVGRPKVRRRSTADIIILEAESTTFVLDEPQKDALVSFWDDDLGGGVLTFTWDDPWPQAGTQTFRIVDFPVFLPITPGPNRKFRTTLKLEQLP